MEKNSEKEEKNTNKPARIERISPPIPVKSPKEVKEISKYFKPITLTKDNNGKNKLYTQAFKNNSNTKEVLKIKEAFPSLKAKNINNIQKIINVNNNSKHKSHINITTKGLSQKQVIVSISSDNKKNFMDESNTYVLNMNRILKNIKSNVLVDFICTNAAAIMVVTNKVISSLYLQTIEQYIKDANRINSNSPRLLQSKSYLKIIGLLYLQENTVTLINLNVVENIIKDNYIFNNITLASKSRVIKVLLKSDIAIIWIDIWDVQSGSKAKMPINRYFNVGNYITIIQEANMNSGISQYKNYWR